LLASVVIHLYASEWCQVSTRPKVSTL